MSNLLRYWLDGAIKTHHHTVRLNQLRNSASFKVKELTHHKLLAITFRTTSGARPKLNNVFEQGENSLRCTRTLSIKQAVVVVHTWC